MEMIETICGNNKQITKKEFAQRVEYVKDNFGENAKIHFYSMGVVGDVLTQYNDFAQNRF